MKKWDTFTKIVTISMISSLLVACQMIGQPSEGLSSSNSQIATSEQTNSQSVGSLDSDEGQKDKSIDIDSQNNTSYQTSETAEKDENTQETDGWARSLNDLSNVELADTVVELHRAQVNHAKIEEYAELSYSEIEGKLKELGLYIEIPDNSKEVNGENTPKFEYLNLEMKNDSTGQSYINQFTLGLINYDPLVVQDVTDTSDFAVFLDEVWYNPELISWTINKPDEPEGYCVYKYDPVQDLMGVEPNYAYDKDTSYKMQDELYEKQINIVQWGLYNQKNIDEYAQYLVCYLKSNAEYDYKALDAQYDTRTQYGPIVNGNGICSGFQKAFQYLMGLAGYESQVITGYYGDILHAWNAIEDSQGNKVYIDTTTGVSSEASWDLGYNINLEGKYSILSEFNFAPTSEYLGSIKILQE